MLFALVACSLLAAAFGQQSTPSVKVVNKWQGGWQGEISVTAGKSHNGFEIELKFGSPVERLEIWDLNVVWTSPDHKTFVLGSKGHNGNLGAGRNYKATFVARSNTNSNANAIIKGDGGSNPGGNPGGNTGGNPGGNTGGNPGGNTGGNPGSKGKYDYDKVLELSILFYEAQRAGKLPSNKRIPWRGDSMLNDRGHNGEDLSKGWFDAGDLVKFNFPMAFSVTQLAWGLIDYRDAYAKAGQLNWMLECIKWPLDYFINCHPSKYELYGEVGDGHKDHGWWGRPEQYPLARPVGKITADRPGTELAAETAAAMAAGSMAFRETNAGYAATLLRHAKELYDFANEKRGNYRDAIPLGKDFYGSHSGYGDELYWAAAWLYRATKDNRYLQDSDRHIQEFGLQGASGEYSWDDKRMGAHTLLYKLTKNNKYKSPMESYINGWLPGSGKKYTPKGLAYHSQWGCLRYVSNTAYLALVAADSGVQTDRYRKWAKSQIDYALGDGGRSYVCGFGNNPPHSPHHRGASCPNMPAPCGWNEANQGGPSPQILYGALVGGPREDDSFANNRKDFIYNEVATDYNAGFQSAVAAIRHYTG